MSLSRVDREIYVALYNLTRAKNAKKVFVCKRCQTSVDIKKALSHFNSHLEREAAGLIRLCGYCNRTFHMHNMDVHELSYRRHVYECLSCRPCAGKLLQTLEYAIKNTQLAHSSPGDSQCDGDVTKVDQVPEMAAIRTSPSSEANACLGKRPCPEATASSLSLPTAAAIDKEKAGILPLFSEQAVALDNEKVRRSLMLALGKFANPFKNQRHAEKYQQGHFRREQDVRFFANVLDHRDFFRRLVAIVRKKLQHPEDQMAAFDCRITAEILPVNGDLLRHMREHSGSREVRVCCKCNARFIFFNDYEENIYLYHVLRCVLHLDAKKDKEVRAFIDICRQGYLIDPSDAAQFDEAAFLRGDRTRALQGYQAFLAKNPASNATFCGDREAMYRVLQLFPASVDVDHPLLSLQIRDTLRFYDERFEEMLDYEFNCRNKWASPQDAAADDAFNCKKCARDKAAIADNTFDRYINTLEPYRMDFYRQQFLSNDVFLSHFPPEWLIGIEQNTYCERLPVEMGFHFWLVLIAHKLPYKHFSLFDAKEKKNKAIFMHIFVYLKYAKKILQELLSNDNLYYVLPYTCLCRDASLLCGATPCAQSISSGAADTDNVHRHIIVVFRHRQAFSTFIRRSRIIDLDYQRVREQNNRRSTVAVAKRRKIMDTASAEKPAQPTKRAQIKTKYMIPILNHAHYYHAIRYVSRDKVSLKAKTPDSKPEDGNEKCRPRGIPQITKRARLLADSARQHADRVRHDDHLAAIAANLSTPGNDTHCKGNSAFLADEPEEDPRHFYPSGDGSDPESDDGATSPGGETQRQPAKPALHSRFSRHFYFSIPMVYHAKPCLFLLYPNGPSDWLAESFMVKHLRYRLLRCVRQKTYVHQGRVCVDYVVRLHDIAPYLNNYIEGHGFPLNVVWQDASYPGEQSAEMECAKAGLFIVSNRIDFKHVCYFDDLRDVDVRLPPLLVRDIKAMDSTARQLIRFNLAMYQHLQIAAEKIFWLNQRTVCLSDQLKHLTDVLSCAHSKLTDSKNENVQLVKKNQNLQSTIGWLMDDNSNKEIEIKELRKQVACLNAVVRRLCAGEIT